MTFRSNIHYGFTRGSPWYIPRRRSCRIHTQLFSVGQESLLIGQNIVEDEELCGDAVSGTHRSTTLSLPERDGERESEIGGRPIESEIEEERKRGKRAWRDRQGEVRGRSPQCVLHCRANGLLATNDPLSDLLGQPRRNKRTKWMTGHEYGVADV